jgi:hypothetical protein
MKRIIVAGLVALCLAGCAPTVWRKDGATAQDFNVDSYACEKDVRQSGYFGSGLSASLDMEAFYNKCMVAHGWTPQKT